MERDTSGFKPLDPGRVNAMDPVELEWWAAHLGCSCEHLEAAIGAVGEHVAEIHAELQRRGVATH